MSPDTVKRASVLHTKCVCCLTESNQLSLHGRCPKCQRLIRCSKKKAVVAQLAARVPSKYKVESSSLSYCS